MLSKREPLFSHEQREYFHKLRGFYKPQREHPKGPTGHEGPKRPPPDRLERQRVFRKPKKLDAP